VREVADDDRRIFDGSDDLQASATMWAMSDVDVDIDVENLLEQDIGGTYPPTADDAPAIYKP